MKLTSSISGFPTIVETHTNSSRNRSGTPHPHRQTRHGRALGALHTAKKRKVNLELETTFSLDATERPGGNILRMPLEAVSPVRELVNPIAKAVLEKFHGDPCVMSHKGP